MAAKAIVHCHCERREATRGNLVAEEPEAATHILSDHTAEKRKA